MTATIGDNAPPPVETFGMHINDLFEEAKGILDGAGVQSDADAEMVGKLMDMARTVKKDADAQRATEKKPHDDAGKAVQAAYKPLLDKCDLILVTCRQVLTPYQLAKEAEQRRIADEARAEAERQQMAAIEARRAAGADLAAREEAERQAKDADRANRDAAKLAKAKPLIATEGRSIGLRTTWAVTFSDPAVALRYYREHQPDALKAWLIDQAERDVRSGARAIPGFTITPERKAA